MKAKLRRAAGEIEDGASAEIIAKAETQPDGQRAVDASPGSPAAEYTLRDEEGHEATVSTRDFEIER